MSARNWWEPDELRRALEAHVRRARYAQQMARETTGNTRETWRQHGRQHVKAARRQNWLIVAHARSLSAGTFFRRTAGYDERARAS